MTRWAPLRYAERMSQGSRPTVLALRRRSLRLKRRISHSAIAVPMRNCVGSLRFLRTRRHSRFDEESTIERLVAKADFTPFCVDVAASDGSTMSNTLALFKRGWAGLSVEMDPLLFRDLASTHVRFPGSALSRGRVTPDNICGLLHAAGAPREFGFLNLDIDGYDFFVLERLLQEFRPSLICAEINEKIPPPLKFTVTYDPAYTWDHSHFYGQSISQLDVLCKKHAYVFVALEYNNAFVMPQEVWLEQALTAAEAYRIGYLDQQDRKERLPWNADMEPLLTLAPHAAVEFLRTAFSAHEGHYTLEVE